MLLIGPVLFQVTCWIVENYVEHRIDSMPLAIRLCLDSNMATPNLVGETVELNHAVVDVGAIEQAAQNSGVRAAGPLAMKQRAMSKSW